MLEMKLLLPRLVMSTSVLESFSAVLESTPEHLETGLTLFGTHHQGCHVVLHAIGPGENAAHYTTSHQPDIEYLNREFERLERRKRSAIEEIGLYELKLSFDFALAEKRALQIVLAMAYKFSPSRTLSIR
jgi:hypothetical protein